MSKFLLKNKEKETFENFSQKFYDNLRLYHQSYKEEQFDDLLLELYNKENDVYGEWCKLFTKIPYFFVRNNVTLATCSVANENRNAIVIGYEMYKKQQSIISRSLPIKATVTTVNESKEKVLLELNKTLLLMKVENEENIVLKAQKEFSRCFSEYENDPYLNELYTNIYENFEQKILLRVESEINRVAGISKGIVSQDHMSALVADIEHRRKSHRKAKFFKQTF